MTSDATKPYPRRQPAARLSAECYVGLRTVFLTICVADPAISLTTGHLSTTLAALMNDTANRTGHVVRAWVLMPEHLHALVEGIRDTADVREWVRRFKSRSAYQFKQRYGDALWQRGFYDRVLRSAEPLERVCQYIADNPRRKRLCADWRDWPFSGGDLYDELLRGLA